MNPDWILGWDPGGYYPSSEVHSPFSCFLHCPVFFWMKTQASSSKCPLTGVLFWTTAWNQKPWEQPKTILSKTLNAAVLSATSLGARTDHIKFIQSPFATQSREILQVVINRRLLNNSGSNQEKPFCGVFSVISLSPVRHWSIPQLWLKVLLMFCKGEKMDESRKSPFDGLGWFLHTHGLLIPSVLSDLHRNYMIYLLLPPCSFCLLLQISLSTNSCVLARTF